MAEDATGLDSYRELRAITDATGEDEGGRGQAGAAPVIPVFVLAEIRLVRVALALLLDGIAGMRVVGTGGLSDELPTVASSATILFPVCSPGGLDAAQRISERHPRARLIALGVPRTEEAILACAEVGVSGFIASDGCLDDLIETVESLQSGGAMGTLQVMAALLRRIAATAAEGRRNSNGERLLTAREREIAELIGQGLSNQEIADRLHIALPTVKNHVHHILDKFGLASRTEIAAALLAPACPQQSSISGNGLFSLNGAAAGQSAATGIRDA